MEMYLSTLLMYSAASPSTLVFSTYLLTRAIRPGKSFYGKRWGEKVGGGARGREERRKEERKRTVNTGIIEEPNSLPITVLLKMVLLSISSHSL